MTKTFVLLFVFSSISAFASPVKTLICESSYAKLGLISSSDELFVADPNAKDTDVIKAGNEHGRVSISYSPVNDEFSGSGEDGCIQISYMTVTAPDGSITLFETEDETGAVAEFKCRKL